MRSFRFLIFTAVLVSACTIRTARREGEINVEQIRDVLLENYQHFASRKMEGKFSLTTENSEISGKFTLFRDGKNWILLIQNPLNPQIFRVSEDTILIEELIMESLSPKKVVRVDKNAIKTDIQGNPVFIYLSGTLPKKVAFQDYEVYLQYRGKLINALSILTPDFTITLTFKD